MPAPRLFELKPSSRAAHHYPAGALEKGRIEVRTDGRARFFLGETTPLLESASLSLLLQSLHFTMDDLDEIPCVDEESRAKAG